MASWNIRSRSEPAQPARLAMCRRDRRHADHRRRGARAIWALQHRAARAGRSPADELLVKIVASGMCQTDQHGRDGYYNTPLPAVFGHEGAGIVAAVGKGVTEIRARRSRRHFVSLVRHLRQLPAPHGGALPKHFDLKMRGTRPDGSTLMSRGRRAGLQRVLPAILVCDLRHRQRAVCGEGQKRCAARAARAVRLQRADRRRRGAQLDAPRAGRRHCRVRRRSGRVVRPDGGKNRTLRSDHRGRHPRPAPCARTRARCDACHQSQRPHRHRRRDPQDHRRRACASRSRLRPSRTSCARRSKR